MMIYFKEDKMNKELIKNKVAAMLLILLGLASMRIDNDATVLVFLTVVAFVLFFSKENVIDI